MKLRTALIGLSLLILGSVPASALEREGSIPEDLAAKNPPPPNDVYVAVLPFWARDDRQAESARACAMLNLMRHGFRVAPRGSRSLAAVARRTDSALRKDRKSEPLARLEPQDVARVAKTLGAQWAIYGEFGDLHTESEKGGIIPRKMGTIDLRVLLVDVSSADTLYWSRVRDKYSSGGGLWPAKATSIERRLVTQAINAIFDDIAAALPDHYAGPEVTQEEVRQLMEAMEK